MDESADYRVADAKTVMALRRATGMAIKDSKRFLETAAPELRARLLLAIESQVDPRFLHDPIEDDPKIKQLIDAADKEAAAELKDVKQRIDFCHLFWFTKKRILKERFDIAWFSPQEMNPGTRFC
jgi:hypothetical protein